jgi:hypothetical protein
MPCVNVTVPGTSDSGGGTGGGGGNGGGGSDGPSDPSPGDGSGEPIQQPGGGGIVPNLSNKQMAVAGAGLAGALILATQSGGSRRAIRRTRSAVMRRPARGRSATGTESGQ